MNNQKKASGLALIPFLVFIVVYLGFGIYYTSIGTDYAFYQFPSATAMLIGCVSAFLIFKGTIDEKFVTFAKGASNIDVLTMLVIYMLAGAFATTAASMGGRDATVNFGLSIIPTQFLVAGLFVIAAFMGTATGTSMGTVAAITPIAAGVAVKAGLSIPITVAGVVGGALFGDNLSMISDTTIAATRSQHCEMKDKFRVNFMIALPAAIVTIIILLITGRPDSAPSLGDLSYNFIKVIPYIAVLVLALIGLNVFLTLSLGILIAGVIGLLTGDLTVPTWAQAVWSGITGMDETFYLTFLCSGLAELVTKNGGIEWVIAKFRGFMKGNKSAQVGIAGLVAVCDACIANNTIAIIVAGKVANEISHEYKVDPRRTASLLDIFACVVQGLLPYMAQLLSAASLASSVEGVVLSPAELVPFMFYNFLLAVFGIISIFVPFADGVTRKDPWNYEYDCAESGVEAKKAQLAIANEKAVTQ